MERQFEKCKKCLKTGSFEPVVESSQTAHKKLGWFKRQQRDNFMFYPLVGIAIWWSIVFVLFLCGASFVK